MQGKTIGFHDGANGTQLLYWNFSLYRCRYLGRGWIFDEIEETTLLSVDVYCNYLLKFYVFIYFCSPFQEGIQITHTWIS